MRMQGSFTTNKSEGRFLTAALALVLVIGLAACDTNPTETVSRAESEQGHRLTLEDLAERRAQARALADAQSEAQARGREKVEVCHRTSSESMPYVLIEVAAPAVDAHLGHGDGLIGDEVPDQAGYTFGDDCTPVETVVSCPCFDAATLDLAFEFNHEWVHLYDWEFSSGDKYVWLDNDVIGHVWSFIVQRTNGTHSCSYGIPTLELGASEDNITVEEAEACRLLIYDEFYERGGECTETDPPNSCDVPFTEDAARPLASLQR